ncbi:type II toxin-antitoxin system VapB family antitoxin [Streptomyces sp. ME19-01-6]|uniref:type II toxin-antitoxin system VapB family antitoxin n=1 Tax=Streptomyces sp. ME19-01-6 TaxID=3028686 RepID=UPI0029ACA92B|nr:type II toxin-antitoxin system VapB family antitoxin [Streptomyces sp. ME19-01-6]MDX3233615.1 type II toxin-antitoxin system VapB family antitoxin [Streptomyces sp. ME19-01-6]
MSRTMIDLDDEMVEHAMRLYGVKTKAKAVRMAMEEAVKRRLRQEGIDSIKSGDLDLTYDSRTEPDNRNVA